VTTVVFVLQRDRALLIRKKRGLGAGKVNAPGGRVEVGETPAEGAARELWEEVCLHPDDLSHRGVVSFQFLDGYSTYMHVFRTTKVRGTPTETEEADPMWVPLDEIPYEQMWADDNEWLPHFLAGKRFEGWGLFDGDNMLDFRLKIEKGNDGWNNGE
jgi:8-oxo-dGTP diphosphatase